MKKFFMIVGFIILIGGGVCLFVMKNKVVCRYFLGSAQVLNLKNCKVFTDGEEDVSIKVFEMNELENGERVNRIVLWIPTFDKPLKRDILIIDRDEYLVGRPNSNLNDYQLMFNKFLFQADYAQWFVAFSDDIKGFKFNPELKIAPKDVSFKVPQEIGLPYEEIRLFFEIEE